MNCFYGMGAGPNEAFYVDGARSSLAKSRIKRIMGMWAIARVEYSLGSFFSPPSPSFLASGSQQSQFPRNGWSA
jgi:hypothetical protein